MDKLRSTARIVRHILATDKQARNSDSYLYLKVIEQQAIEKQINIRNISITSFLVNSSIWGFAPFESVRRARQKEQQKNPELAASPKVEEMRDIKETEFREYARS